jgi:hypothetical protein
MVLWHGCQIDKSDNQERTNPEKAFAAVAPIQPLDKLQSETAEKTEQLRASVMAGGHSSYFFLPAVTAGEFALVDSFVNLRYIWSVRQTTLLQKRRAALHSNMLFSLYEKLFIFFTRFRLDVTPNCPSCGTAVPLTPVEEED